MDSPSSNRCWSFPNALACCWPSLYNRPISRYMEFCSLVIRGLNLARTPPRWPANWFNSSRETKLGVGVLERSHTSRPKAILPIVLVSSGPGVRLLLWMIVSCPPVISASWVSSVIIADRDVSGRRYTGNFFVLYCTGLEGI